MWIAQSEAETRALARAPTELFGVFFHFGFGVVSTTPEVGFYWAQEERNHLLT